MYIDNMNADDVIANDMAFFLVIRETLLLFPLVSMGLVFWSEGKVIGNFSKEHFRNFDPVRASCEKVKKVKYDERCDRKCIRISYPCAIV